MNVTLSAKTEGPQGLLRGQTRLQPHLVLLGAQLTDRPLKSLVVTEFFLPSDEKLIEKSKSPPQMIYKKWGHVHIFLRRFRYRNS